MAPRPPDALDPAVEDLPPAGGKEGVELVKRATKAEQQAEAVRLRVAGKDYGQIAEALECHPTTARKMVDRWLESRRPAQEVTEELIKISDARLEILHDVWWGPALQGDQAALDNVLKILDRRAKIMGMEVPRSTNVTVVTAESIVAFLDMAGGKAPPRQVEAKTVDVEATEVTG